MLARRQLHHDVQLLGGLHRTVAQRAAVDEAKVDGRDRETQAARLEGRVRGPERAAAADVGDADAVRAAADTRERAGRLLYGRGRVGR